MLLCIDASYLLFYRINALKVWFKHYSKEHATETDLMSEDFQHKLCKMIHTCVIKLCKTHKPSQILFAYDGHKNWRKIKDTEYKATRTQQKAITHLFQLGVSCLKKVEILCCPTFHMEHEALEADDIIHYVVRKRNNIQHKEFALHTTIIANDYDYLPLLEYTSTVRIINLQKKVLTLPQQLSGEQYLLMKIIVGDKSDNIPSILKRCGIKTAMKIVVNDTLFSEKITHGDADVQKKFQHNQTLIDNRFVPKKYQTWMETHLQPFWITSMKKNNKKTNKC